MHVPKTRRQFLRRVECAYAVITNSYLNDQKVVVKYSV